MRAVLLSPGDPSRRTGGFAYNRRLVAGLQARGHAIEVQVLEGDWPHAGAPPRLEEGVPVIADGLLLTALASHVAGHRVLALVHSPLVHEHPALEQAEHAALRDCEVLVATSAMTAHELQQALQRPVHALVPGVERQPPGQPEPGRWLCVGALIPRKDPLAVLRAAREAGGEVVFVGEGPLRPALMAEGAVLLGELDRAALQAEYRRAELLVHGARYEAYGMVLAEAVAHGVPVVCTPCCGAVANLGRAAVVSADLAAGIRAAQAELPGLRRAAVAVELPSWETVVRGFEELLGPLSPPARTSP